MTPERRARIRAVLARRQPDLWAVTDFVHKQRNLSALVRIADAFGLQSIHAVLKDEDYQAFRGTATGSHAWVEVHRHATLTGVLERFCALGVQLVAADIGADASDYRDIDYTQPTALVLGAERRGLAADTLAQMDYSVSIPMVGMVDSLNVSVAAGIILAEAQRQRQAAGLYETCRLDAQTYNRLLFEWGHPVVRDFCRERGLRYPALDETGEIESPSAWYAKVRAGTAPLWEGPDV